jgi:hypothetical protein
MRRQRDRLHLVFLLVVLLAVLLVQGCAAGEAARAARKQRDLQRAVLALERKADADSLAAAGLLSPVQGGPGLAVSLLARATAAAPDRADLVWLEIEICRQAPGCDPEPHEQRLRTLDPSNGAGWLYAIARASESRDEAASRAALADLARAPRVDIYWTTLVAHLTGALADTGGVPLTDAVVDVIGVLSAQSIPSYKAISDQCLGQRLADPERLDHCQRIASAFEQGDTWIIAMIGAAWEKRVWPADSPPWQAAQQARRVYQYRSELWTQAEADLLRDPQRVRKFLALCAQNRREQDVYRIELIDEGKSPDPPPGWKSRSP